jgi:hypothetical protein
LRSALSNIKHQLFLAMMENKPLTIQPLLNNQAGRVLQPVDDKQNHLILTETHLRLHTRI